MRIRLGYEMTYAFTGPTPMIVMLNVHYSRVAQLERPDHLMTNPPVPVQSYRDSFGNWCCRLVAPAGNGNGTGVDVSALAREVADKYGWRKPVGAPSPLRPR